eukprot:scaffold90650_cov51-Phaeocystis_antarctica.AAC.2
MAMPITIVGQSFAQVCGRSATYYSTYSTTCSILTHLLSACTTSPRSGRSGRRCRCLSARSSGHPVNALPTILLAAGGDPRAGAARGARPRDARGSARIN